MNWYKLFEPLIPYLKWLEKNPAVLVPTPISHQDAILGPLPPEKDAAKENPTPPLKTQRSASLILYDTAYSFIGKDASPRDFAQDEYGCVDSLQEVIRAAGRAYIAGRTLSTATLCQQLLKSPAYKLINGPELGAVTVFPTAGDNHGHCGIVGRNYVMSNDSNSGYWLANYTLAGWSQTAKNRRLPVFYFRPL